MLQQKAQVLWNYKICDSYYKLGLQCSDNYESSHPGQFIMLGIDEIRTNLFRRPFSIHRLIKRNGLFKGIELLYKVVGKTTSILSTYDKSNKVDILGPLGKGFKIKQNCKHFFFVAGGVGVAPLLYLVLSLQEHDFDLSSSVVFLGGKSKNDLLCIDDFLNMGMSVQITTDNGSKGQKGLITDLLKKSLIDKCPDVIYTCGPYPMIKAVVNIAEKHKVACQVSIETIMACGMGVCLGCAVEKKKYSDKYLHVCIDGPVFESDILNLS